MGESGSGVAYLIAALVSTATSLVAANQRASIPNFPQFQIPSEDLAAINQQIAGNTQLSNEARATATQALSSYNAGQLSSAYAGQYKSDYEKQLAAYKQQLAAQGFTEGSTQYQNAMNQFQQWAGNYKSQLLQAELNDALKMGGMSDMAVSDYLNKWGAQTSAAGGAASVGYQGALANIMGANQTSQQLTRAGTAVGNLSSLFANPKTGPMNTLFGGAGSPTNTSGVFPVGSQDGGSSFSTVMETP